MSIALNGNTSNYLSIASTLGMTSASAQTICGWFKVADTNTNKQAFAFLAPNGYGTVAAMLFQNNGNLYGYGSSTSQGSSLLAYSSAAWYFIYWRRDTSGPSLRMGRAASGFTSTTDFADGAYTLEGYTATDGYNSLEIGRKGSDGYPFNGEACCVRVWDTLLTTDELLAEAKSASAVKSANLRANWRLATKTDLTSTVNSYALTFNGTPADGSTEPTDIAAAVQILLPASDITTTGWTASGGGALYAAIDEAVASDTDYITTGTLNAECEVKLQPGSTPGSGSKNLKVRCPAGFTPVGNWSVSLYQGASLVQAFTSPVPTADTTVTFAVTNAITDYSDLRVRIKSTA